MKTSYYKTIHRATLRDGTKKLVVEVPITVTVWNEGGMKHESVSCSEWQKVDQAIEKAWPGWFHKFTKGGKHRKGCQACLREKRSAADTLRKILGR